jgi:hypothetical protein
MKPMIFILDFFVFPTFLQRIMYAERLFTGSIDMNLQWFMVISFFVGNKRSKIMIKLYNRFWVIVTVVLSIVVTMLGFPVFQRKFGFPASLLWTFVVLFGVWATYLIRAYMFSSSRPERKEQEMQNIKD